MLPNSPWNREPLRSSTRLWTAQPRERSGLLAGFSCLDAPLQLMPRIAPSCRRERSARRPFSSSQFGRRRPFAAHVEVDTCARGIHLEWQNSYSDAATANALDRERHFGTRSSDFAILSY